MTFLPLVVSGDFASFLFGQPAKDRGEVACAFAGSNKPVV
jgi:hypothetical protein